MVGLLPPSFIFRRYIIMSSRAIYFVHDEVDYIFEEKGNGFSAFRKLQWAKDGEESNIDKAKYELRRWYVDKEGEEVPGKGFTFSTDAGPSAMVELLVEKGFGNTKELLNILKSRDDFRDSVESLDSNYEEDSDGQYFDAREMLLVV